MGPVRKSRYGVLILLSLVRRGVRIDSRFLDSIDINLRDTRPLITVADPVRSGSAECERCARTGIHTLDCASTAMSGVGDGVPAAHVLDAAGILFNASTSWRRCWSRSRR